MRGPRPDAQPCADVRPPHSASQSASREAAKRRKNIAPGVSPGCERKNPPSPERAKATRANAPCPTAFLDKIVAVLIRGKDGRLAQLVRAPALQAGGRRFESCTAHHSISGNEI